MWTVKTYSHYKWWADYIWSKGQISVTIFKNTFEMIKIIQNKAPNELIKPNVKVLERALHHHKKKLNQEPFNVHHQTTPFIKKNNINSSKWNQLKKELFRVSTQSINHIVSPSRKAFIEHRISSRFQPKIHQQSSPSWTCNKKPI